MYTHVRFSLLAILAGVLLLLGSVFATKAQAQQCRCCQPQSGIYVPAVRFIPGTWQPTLTPAPTIFPRRFVRYRKGVTFVPSQR